MLNENENILAVLIDGTQDIIVSGLTQFQPVAEEHGFEWHDGAYMISGHVMTGISNAETREGFAKRAAQFLIQFTIDQNETKNARHPQP